MNEIAKVGDVVEVDGKKHKLDVIYYQEYDDGDWEINFESNGRFFMWKQKYEGGRLIKKEE